MNEKILRAMTDIDDALLASAEPEPKKKNGIFIKYAGIAACLCAVIAAIIALIPVRRTDPAMRPDNVINNDCSEQSAALLSAFDIGKAFEADGERTRKYAEVTVKDISELKLKPIPEAEYLPVYEINGVDNAPSAKELEAWGGEKWKRLFTSLGKAAPELQFVTDSKGQTERH